MKKLLLVFIMFIVLMISGCSHLKEEDSIVKKSDFELIIEKFINLNDYTIKMTSPYDDIITIKYNANDKYMIEKNDTKHYYKLTDNKLHKYYKLNDIWYKENNNDLKLISESEIFNMKELEFSWFEKEDNIYFLKEDFFNIVKNFIYDIDKVTFVVKDNSLLIKIYSNDYDGIYKIEYLDFNETVIKLPEATDELVQFEQFLNIVVNAKNFRYYDIWGGEIKQENNKISYLYYLQYHNHIEAKIGYEELLNGEYYSYDYSEGIWNKNKISNAKYALYDFKNLNINMFDNIDDTNSFSLNPQYFDDLCINRDTSIIKTIEFQFTEYGMLYITIAYNDCGIRFRVYGFDHSEINFPDA